MINKKYFLCLTFIFLLLSFVFSHATIRYVSHTGSSTPPYITWATAADSIQKCIDYSVDGDTIIVANGVYYESLIVNKYLWLIGSSMDSTIIDGTGLAGTTVYAQADFDIEGFRILGKVRAASNYVIVCQGYNINIRNCNLSKAGTCIYFGRSSGSIENVIATNCNTGITTFCVQDTCQPKIINSLIIMENAIDEAIDIFDGGNPTIAGNIIVSSNSDWGINVSYSVKTIFVKNNIISGFEGANIYAISTTDTAIVQNNTTSYQNYSGSASIQTGAGSNVSNNIIAYNRVGIRGEQGVSINDYNLYWQNVVNTSGGSTLDSTDVLADPMFVKDTIPVYGGSYNYHLQMFSPAIDSGDPNILDVDGTRSDIGAYGGPGGESYTYIDLPPRPPVNLSAEIDTVSNIVILTWNKNSEADTAYYNVYRDSTINFPVDSSKLISSQADTVYLDVIPPGYRRVVYKVTAVDKQGNESQPSEEQIINLVGVEREPKVVNNYFLYQNYPNPFNPSTKIGYKLIERGYVKLMIYDIKGELVTVLVNEVQESGYYEVEFNASAVSSHSGLSGISALASGIYLYRIEVIGEGNIPRFSDMKKMILIK